MSIKSILATLAIIGSSSVALASPSSDDPCQTPAPVAVAPAPVHRIDYRPPIEYRPPVRRPMPPIKREVTLGSQTQRWFGNTTFSVGQNMGRFQTLKLETERGRSFIDTVTIRFMDGRMQTVKLDKDLNASNPCLTIDLAGQYPRAIASVTVRGVNARRSAFEVKAV
jgi:hypothetical protein